MNQRIFVIAGNHNEFNTFAVNKLNQWYREAMDKGEMFSMSMSNFVYVSSLDSLAGHRNIHGYFYGSFRDRPDIRDIVRHIRMRNDLPADTQLIPDLYVGRGINLSDH